MVESFFMIGSCLIVALFAARLGSTFCSYRPKWSLAAMSGASRLVPPMIFSFYWALFLCAAYDSGATYVDGCLRSPPHLVVVHKISLPTSFNSHHFSRCLFFCSTLLRCDLLAKKVPGRAPYSQHIIFRKWTYLNRSKTEHLKSFRPKTANKPINKLDRRRIWQKSVGSKSVQGEDRKERVANRELCR